MFIKKLNIAFLLITIIASLALVYIWYKDFLFLKEPLPQDIQNKVAYKTTYLRNLSLKKFGVTQYIPVYISNKMKDKLFGMTTYSKDGSISIFLNKKRFKESVEYMIDSVLPHEYAHALMFVDGDFARQNSGHTLKWQKICKALDGKRCDRFVDTNDIIIGKTNPFKIIN